MFEGPAVVIAWLMTPAIVAIGGFCVGLAFYAISKHWAETSKAAIVICNAKFGRRRTTQEDSRFIRPLTASELPKYLEHLLRLDPAERRTRFGFPVGNADIIREHQRIDP